MLLFVVGPRHRHGLAHMQAKRYLCMARALRASARVGLACPPGVLTPTPGLDAQPYESERELRALVNDASVAVIAGDLVQTYPTLARWGARLVIDASHTETVTRDVLQTGEFFVCGSEPERQRWLDRLVAIGRVRPKPRGDLRRLVDVI